MWGAGGALVEFCIGLVCHLAIFGAVCVPDLVGWCVLVVLCDLWLDLVKDMFGVGVCLVCLL